MKKPLMFLLYLPLLAHAEWGTIEQDFEQDKPWVEVAAQLPAYPRIENLLPFSVSAVTRHRYFIDAASISVSEDHVVRYTAVIETVGGAKNISFEGLRCETGESRLYAYGHPDGSWSKARNAGWKDIQFRSPLSYQKALYEGFFCPDGIAVKDVNTAVSNLQQGAR